MRQDLQPGAEKANGVPNGGGNILSPEAIHAATTAAAVNISMEELLQGLRAMQAGDFSARLPGNQTGLAGKIADTFNEIISTNERMAQQLERVGEVVGK